MTLPNDAGLLLKALASGRGHPSGPFKLTACVTWQCDQRCTHCRIWRKARSEELSAGEWRQVWRQAKRTLRWIDLTGGEVTTREDFAELAIAAIEELPGLALLHYPSNGRRPAVLERVTRAIVAAAPARLILSLSLDGPPALHDRLRGDEGAFENAVESFRRVRGLGVEAYFGMTLSPYNLTAVEETFAALSQRLPGLGWRDLHVNFLHHSAHYFQNEKVAGCSPAELEAAIGRLVQRRGLPRRPTHLLEHLYLSHVPRFLKTGRSPLPCASLAGNAFLDPTGRVYPCHIWDRPVGRLREHGWSLPAIWALEAARATRREVVAERCPGCWTPCEAYPTILSGPAVAVQGVGGLLGARKNRK